MKLLLALIIFIIAVPAQGDCIREITVQEMFYRSNPNPFTKVLEPYKKGDKKEIFIDCDLYAKIKVGDELSEPGDNVDRIRLFSNDRGLLERKRYLVLKK